MSLTDALPQPYDADAMFDAFTGWANAQSLRLYPAQEEAMVALVSGANVVLATPTGTGKSLVAVGAHALALAQGMRSVYTAPIKALVSEKFFALAHTFGAQNVGMMTGDSQVNAGAPILCCTAEILANLTLRTGEDAPFRVVIMDEFHYYADPERGWAWQVPLLGLPHAQFLLMSATLGDTSVISDDLSRRTGRETAEVTGVDRPVPLSYRYLTTPVHESVSTVLATGLAPVYIVHFSQAAAVERAQALAASGVASRTERDRIAEEIGDFRFATGFGRTLSRLLRLGVGVHHAGMLPGYRRLVERLAQRGVLPVICGTDTLGVGINVPIRTVLLTALTKFDGTKMRQLTAREFHQIAGRAGRAGFDEAGDVVAEAPEHEIENLKAAAKAGDDPKKKRKIVRKKAPAGFVSWSEKSFERLIAAEPEQLVPRLRITSAMMINVIARGGDVYSHVHSLVFDNHEPWHRQLDLARRALGIYRALLAGEVVQNVAGSIRLTVDLQPDFALNQPLSPFALACFDLLDPESPDYALDVVSIVESTLDDPRAVLRAQEFLARGEAVAAMKADGIEYDERRERLEEISWPAPLAELLEQAFRTYASSQPWVRDFEVRPKSVVRDLYERAMTFRDYVSFYTLSRTEGVLLRYLSDAFRTMRQTVPSAAKNEELHGIIEWLGETVRQVDSSLLDEWEQLGDADALARAAGTEPAPRPVVQRPVTANRRAFTVLVRNELFRRVQLAARDRADLLGDLDGEAGQGREEWERALDAYYAEHESIGIDADARSSRMLQIDESAAAEGLWKVRQVIDDPAGDHDWGITGEIDLRASDEQGVAVLRVTGLSRM